MTTEDDPPAVGVGAVRLERRITVIAGVFSALYALQTVDALLADSSSTTGPLGAAASGLMVLGVLLGLAAALPTPDSRRLCAAGAIAGALALAIWPAALTGPVPAAPMPWFAGIAVVPAVLAAAVARRAALPIVLTVLVALHVAVVLSTAGGLPVAEAAVDGLFVALVALVLVLLVTALRRTVRRADEAQRAALRGYAATRFDEATEAERARTDALVHDCVLTTFLAAADADGPDAERLAARMAANALRVLQHVNREGEAGPAIPFTLAIAGAEDRLAPLRPHFTVAEADADVVLPIRAADVLLESMVRAMTSSVEHAGPASRSVSMSRLGPDGLRIVVADDGVGFDPGAGDGRAVAAGLRDRLRAVDGRADLTTAPGSGCRVVLSWGSVVIHGVAPLPVEAVSA